MVMSLPATLRLPHPTTASSIDSEDIVNVEFVNRHWRRATICWIDYWGKLRPYAVCPVGHRYAVQSFASHPWCAIDTLTGDVLAVDGESLIICNVNDGRTAIAIHADPGIRLSSLCLRRLRDNLAAVEMGENDMAELPIGEGDKQRLLRLHHDRKRFHKLFARFVPVQ